MPNRHVRSTSLGSTQRLCALGLVARSGPTAAARRGRTEVLATFHLACQARAQRVRWPGSSWALSPNLRQRSSRACTGSLFTRPRGRRAPSGNAQADVVMPRASRRACRGSPPDPLQEAVGKACQHCHSPGFPHPIFGLRRGMPVGMASHPPRSSRLLLCGHEATSAGVGVGFKASPSRHRPVRACAKVAGCLAGQGHLARRGTVEQNSAIWFRPPIELDASCATAFAIRSISPVCRTNKKGPFLAP